MNTTSVSSATVVYDGAVEPADLDEWERELSGVVTRMAPLFGRRESKRHAEQYLRGLLSPLARKNGWTIAEYVGEAEPKALQRLLNLSPWDADALLAHNREYAMENLADPAGILVADPTGFAKKGRKSVGVQRQYSGTLGRIDNCQIATFLAYVTPRRDRVLIDCRLYLPETSWMADPERCAEAGVPPEVAFATRPEQVRQMIEGARAAEVPFAWFTADEEFGQNPGLCAYLENDRLPYVMGIPKNTTFLDTTGNTHEIERYAQRLAPNVWQRRACGIGAKGHRVYDWARVIAAEQDRQYLIRTRVLPMLQPEPGRIRRNRAGSRRPLADRRMLRIEQERNRPRQLPGPHLERMAPPHRILHARPHLPRHHRASSQKKRRQHTPSDPNQQTRKPRRYIAA